MSMVGMVNPVYKNDMRVLPFSEYMKGEGGMRVAGMQPGGMQPAGIVVGGKYRPKGKKKSKRNVNFCQIYQKGDILLKKQIICGMLRKT